MEFTRWWLTEMKSVKFPTAGTVFDYYIDPETKKFEPWTKKVIKFEYDPEQPLQVQSKPDITKSQEPSKLLHYMRPVLKSKLLI